MFNIIPAEDRSTTELEFIRDHFILTDHDQDLIQFELISRMYQERIAIAAAVPAVI